MPFKADECAIPKVWCGNGKMPKRTTKNYYKIGSRAECVKVGFGAGMYSERKKHLPMSSLQQIPYVGETYEKKFKKIGIKTKAELRSKMSKKSPTEIEKILKKVFTKKGGSFDRRAYNSTLLFLYQNGVGKLPRCRRIKI